MKNEIPFLIFDGDHFHETPVGISACRHEPITFRCGSDRHGERIVPCGKHILFSEFRMSFGHPWMNVSRCHGMPSEGKLTIQLIGRVEGDDVVIEINDDGTGFDGEHYDQAVSRSSGSGLGLALQNVYDRLVGAYGPGSGLEIESALGCGTRVTLLMKDAMTDPAE